MHFPVRVRPSRLLVACLLASAGGVTCGGRTNLVTEQAEGGSPEAGSPDVLSPSCPGSTTTFALGSACAWAGGCLVDLEECPGTEPSPALCLCEAGVVTLPPGVGFACTQTPDAGGPEAACAVGGPCSIPGHCTISGGGPCGSDEALRCGESETWEVADYPCLGVRGCGETTVGPDGGCSESCECTNGQMICTGNCADGGAGLTP